MGSEAYIKEDWSIVLLKITTFKRFLLLKYRSIKWKNCRYTHYLHKQTQHLLKYTRCHV